MITILAGAAIFNDNKILLVQNSPTHREPNKWATPGGHAIAEETPLQTALREVKEETNLDLTINGLSICALATSLNGKEFIVALYTATATNLDSIKSNDPDVVNSAWATKQEIEEDKYLLREQKILKPLLIRTFTTPPAPIDAFSVVHFQTDH